MPHDPDPNKDAQQPEPPVVRQSVAVTTFALVAGGAALYFCLKGLEGAFIVAMLISLGLMVVNLVGGIVSEWQRCRPYVEAVREYRKHQGTSSTHDAGQHTHAVRKSMS